MALEIPIRGYGARVSEQVSTPQVDVSKFKGIANALKDFGDVGTKIGIDIMKAKTEAENNAYLTKATQDYTLAHRKASKDFEDNLDEFGNDTRTGMSYTESMELWSEGAIDNLKSKAPNMKAQNMFGQRIKPTQTKHIINADLVETALFKDAHRKIDGKAATRYSLDVHSMKSGSVQKGEEYLNNVTEMFRNGIGTKYNVAQAKANIDKHGNELAYAAGQTAVRNEDIGGLEALLLGTIRGQKIKMPGFDDTNIDEREISPLEEHLTPPQKNSLLNQLDALYEKRDADQVRNIDAVKDAIRGSVARNDWDPSNPNDKELKKTLVNKTLNYRDRHGKMMHYKNFVDNMVVAYLDTEVINEFNERPFQNPNQLNKILDYNDKAAHKKIRDHLRFHPEAALVPTSKLSNIVDAAISNRKNQLLAARKKALSQNPGAYVTDHKPKLKAKLESINLADPSQIAVSNLEAFTKESIALQHNAGTEISDINPFPNEFYKAALDNLKNIYQQAEPGSDDVDNYIKAYRDSLGDVEFENFANRLAKEDPKLGGIFRTGGYKMISGDNPQQFSNALTRYYDPEMREKYDQAAADKDYPQQKIRNMVGESLAPGFFSFDQNRSNAYKPTVSQLGNFEELVGVQDEITKVATYYMTEGGMEPKKAVERAVEERFKGMDFVSENDSNLLIPRNVQYTANQLRTFVDRTQNTTDLIDVGMGPKNYNELSQTMPSRKMFSQLENSAKNNLLNNPGMWPGGNMPNFDTPEGKKLLEEAVYDDFKKNFVVKWSNKNGGYEAHFVRRKRHGFGMAPSMYGERGVAPDITDWQEFPAYRINSRGNPEPIHVQHKDVLPLLNKIPKKQTERVFDKIFGGKSGQRSPQSEEGNGRPFIIENTPIDIIRGDVEEMLDERYLAETTDRNYRGNIRQYTTLSEEQMDLYEIDPASYERLEDSGVIDEVFD